jgi:acyl phosphate:glycerol-3-phosphate acyltransferase
MMTLYFIVAAIAYLLGSIPFGYVLVRFVRGEDIRLSGSGNIGATNVARSGAKGLGALTLLLDVLKGAAAVWIAAALAASSYNRCAGVSETFGLPCIPALRLMSLAALFAVLGHIFPVWLKFKGGKGVATALGVFALLFPKAVLISLIIFIVVLGMSRYVSLGSILAALAFPIAAYFLYQPPWITLVLTAAVSAVVVLKHRQNIRRLVAGTENRFGSPKASAEKQA